ECNGNVTNAPLVVLALAQSKRGQAEERAAREPPAAVDCIDERRRGRRQAADEDAATRQHRRPEARGVSAGPEPLDVGSEAIAGERAEDGDRREVWARLGEPEPVEGRPPRVSAAQDEAILEKPAAGIAHGDGALEDGEPPRFAERDPAGG